MLSYFKANVGNLSIEQFNVIGAIMGWVANGFKLHPLSNLAYIGVAAVSAVLVVISLIGIVIGKYPRALNSIFSLAAAGAMLALLIKWIVSHTFVAKQQIAFLVVLSLALLNFVLTVVFAILMNKLDDKVENVENMAKEI